MIYYAFRKNAAVLPGDAPLLINPKKGTMPRMFQKAGYKTAVVGKWHLGLGSGDVNWNEAIKPGPIELGFDYSFLIPATGDRVPCVYVENHHVVGLDPNDPITVNYAMQIGDEESGLENPSALKQAADPQHSCTIIDSISRIGYMTGGKKARWHDIDFPYVLTDKAKQFIKGAEDQPFFLYFSFHDIHVPRVPNLKFEGKSTMGPRGDAIAQMDWCTGEIVNYLKELGIEKNTLIIFSSDNGPVLDDGYADDAVQKLGEHDPAGGLRGGKYSAYEAGTRVPTIVYWPDNVKPRESKALLTQVDLYASFAKLIGQPLKGDDAPDSFEMLDAWLGKSDQGRDVMLEEAFTYALRVGNFKYIRPQEKETPIWLDNKDIEHGLQETDQLYDLSSDTIEMKNIAEDKPKILNSLKLELDDILKSEGTRPNFKK